MGKLDALEEIKSLTVGWNLEYFHQNNIICWNEFSY
jgi:hypothetical protein